MNITIIIPTYNRSELLGKTLEGIGQQTESACIKEVIVVSDGSTDATREAAERFSGRLPLRVLEQARLGVSRARNYGLREAKSEVVLFLDDDIVPGPRLVAEHAKFHQEMPCLEAVLMGYVTWHPDVTVTPFMRWFGEYGGLCAFSLLKENQRADPRYLYTCNASFKTEFLRANHGFTEGLSVLEDHELAYRLAKRGMLFFFRRSAIGYHNQSFTFEQACERLRRFSVGLETFLSTEAGQKMAQKKGRVAVRSMEAAARFAVKLVSPLRPLIDSNLPMPNWLYRLFYWYYGTYLSYWSRVPASVWKSQNREDWPGHAHAERRRDRG
jgi:glycosyltransferase involved in cell wall biosynthesis